MEIIVNTIRMVDRDQAKEHTYGNLISLKDKLAVGLMNPKDFRKLIGSDIIRSTLFNVNIVGEELKQEENQKILSAEEKEEQQKSITDILAQKKDWTIKELIDLMKDRKKEKGKEKEKNITEIISKKTPLTFVFSGMGNGHGVGMSQWGAYGMALQGNKCQDILKYYYQGIDIKKIY